MQLRELNNYYIALPKDYILKDYINGYIFFMEENSKKIFLKNNPSLKDKVMLYSQIKNKSLNFVVPNKLVILEYILPVLIQDKQNIFFYGEVNLNSINNLPIDKFVVDENMKNIIINMDNINNLLKNIKKIDLKTLPKMYVFGYRSSGTHYLQNIIAEILFHKVDIKLKILKSVLYKFYRIETISKDSIIIYLGNKKTSVKHNVLCPILVYGSTHDFPKNIKYFCNNIKSVFTYRDGRDICASAILAYSKNDKYKIITEVHDGTPIYYGLTYNDMKKNIIDIIYDMYKWFHNIRTYYEVKDKFITSFRFEDFTIDNPNQEKNVKLIIQELLDKLDYKYNKDEIYKKIQSNNDNILMIRKGYKKIGLYKEVFDKNEILLMNNYLSLPLDLLGYKKNDKYQNQEYIVLLEKGEEEIFEFAQILFNKYNTKISEIIYINDKLKIDKNKKYLVFSKSKIKLDTNIEYFDYYYFYHKYIPTFYNIGIQKEIKLNTIKDKNILAITNKSIITKELISIFTNIFTNITFITDFEESITYDEYDYILNLQVGIKNNYTLCKKLYNTIDKNKILCSYIIGEFKV